MRIYAYLTGPLCCAQLPELDEHNVDRNCEPGFVTIRNGDFSWGTAELTLSGINLEVPRGRLTVIVGQVGSGTPNRSRACFFVCADAHAGKSSMLHSLLGDMERLPEAVVRVGGRVAYAAQTAFIINETVRENVLLYVVVCCASLHRRSLCFDKWASL